MGQLQVPGTSVQYSNPNQLNAAAIDPKTGAPWVQGPMASGTTSWGGCLTYPGPSNPQPGSYDSTPPTAPPVQFNQVSVSASDPSIGGKSVPGTNVTFRNPS
jgi:hypothetical protein